MPLTRSDAFSTADGKERPGDKKRKPTRKPPRYREPDKKEDRDDPTKNY